jgi:hypothetical protein
MGGNKGNKRNRKLPMTFMKNALFGKKVLSLNAETSVEHAINSSTGIKKYTADCFANIADPIKKAMINIFCDMISLLKSVMSNRMAKKKKRGKISRNKLFENIKMIGVVRYNNEIAFTYEFESLILAEILSNINKDMKDIDATNSWSAFEPPKASR